MLVTRNFVKVVITANTQEEREAWVNHFARLFKAATVTRSEGLWEGIAEPSISVEFAGLGADNFAAWVGGKVLEEVRTYQVAACQMACLVEVTLEGQRMAFLLEDEKDYEQAHEYIVGLATGKEVCWLDDAWVERKAVLAGY
jgi:hypothetical protein